MALLPVVLKYGLRAEYDALQEKSSNVLYFLTDTGEIYRGDVNLARGSHYEGIRTIKEDGSYENDNEVFARVLSSRPAVKDDIFVIKTQIGESDKYTYTAYTYDGENWAAMDGNYNADNVIFDKDMIVTNNIGAFQMPNGVSSTTLPTAGKSLKDVLANLLAKELQPVRVSSPSVNLTSKINNGAYKWVEVGDEVLELSVFTTALLYLDVAFPVFLINGIGVYSAATLVEDQLLEPAFVVVEGCEYLRVLPLHQVTVPVIVRPTVVALATFKQFVVLHLEIFFISFSVLLHTFRFLLVPHVEVH